ncbi:MAG: isoprenyl transferase [bacterium]|nr:isoprenyl transferase [bacterium]
MTLDPERMAQMQLDKLPRHIAIIMDGNGRWASQRKLPRIAGHREGVNSVVQVVTAARLLNIQALTLYSFSLENWKRPQMEIEALMAILDSFVRKEVDRMNRENIRFNTIGQLGDLPYKIQEIVNDAVKATRDNGGMVFTLALSYGSRQEILQAVQNCLRDMQAGRLSSEELSTDRFSQYLWTADLPEPDLLIRTSGELRISNFLLWQIAYTELYFTDVLWPDFGSDNLLDAILAFQKRQRRFGYTGEQVQGVPPRGAE